MTDQTLIPVECISKTGARVVFHVREVVSIDGRPLRPDENDVICNILTRLAAVEAAISKTTEDDHAHD